MRLPKPQLAIELTPVAIALIAVLGIVAVAYSPMDSEIQSMAVLGLSQLAGGATGVAMPRIIQQLNRSSGRSPLPAPDRLPPDW